jgi:hypothetical protein
MANHRLRATTILKFATHPAVFFIAQSLRLAHQTLALPRGRT